MKVIHNAGSRDISIYINSQLKHTMKDTGSNTHYFKCGVYAQKESSHEMQSYFKNIKVFNSGNVIEEQTWKSALGYLPLILIWLFIRFNYKLNLFYI